MDDKETPRKTNQKDNVMTIFNKDGSTTEVENPFLSMQLQIAIEQAAADERKRKQELIDAVLGDTKSEQEEKKSAFQYQGNRHERRKQAAIERRKK